MKNKIYHKSFSWFDFEVYPDKPDFAFKEVHQTHSDHLASFSLANLEAEADGILATKKELQLCALAIKTADCLPVVIWNDKELAFIHAGHRGLQKQIFKKITFIPTHAFIGPSISSSHYEVQKDFLVHFSQTHFDKRGDKLFFDLQKEARHQLLSLQNNILVQDSGVCTFSNLEYNSFRRNKTVIRNYNIIRFKG